MIAEETPSSHQRDGFQEAIEALANLGGSRNGKVVTLLLITSAHYRQMGEEYSLLCAPINTHY